MADDGAARGPADSVVSKGRPRVEDARGRVCAVIPSYNRAELLCEALTGLATQTRPLDTVLVVDNASTDGTTEQVSEQFPWVNLLRLDFNTGSAGGFATGIRWAYESGHDWVWLVDNDSVPEPDALAELLAAHDRFTSEPRPDLLAAKVLWTDGTLLPMNTPTVKRRNADLLYWAAEHATLSIRYAPYAGVLVSRRAIEAHGLPLSDYFLYDDDTEYTGRILSDRLGVLVPTSIVRHNVPKKLSSQAESGDRFFYALRNKLWLVRCAPGWTPLERVTFVLALARNVARFLRQPSGCSRTALVLRALTAGLLRRPGPVQFPAAAP